MKFELPNRDKLNSWPPDNYNNHLIAIGRIVFNWNAIENGTRNLLTLLLGGGNKLRIATTHMGTNTQLDAITTIANQYLPEDEREALLHQLKVYQRIREYRNYFVHGFSELRMNIINPDNASKAGMKSERARGRHVFDELKLSADDMQAVADLLHAFSKQCARINCHYMYRGNPSPQYKAYQTLPEKFPLPDRLEKFPRDIPPG